VRETTVEIYTHALHQPAYMYAIKEHTFVSSIYNPSSTQKNMSRGKGKVSSHVRLYKYTHKHSLK